MLRPAISTVSSFLSITAAAMIFTADATAMQPRYRVVELGTLGGDSTYAAGLNINGVVVGSSKNSQDLTRAFVWQDGVMTELPTLGGEEGSAFDVNDLNQIVGNLETPDGVPHAIRWDWVDDQWQITDLGAFDGHEIVLNSINNNGRIVGHSKPKSSLNFHALFWEDDVMIELPELSAGWEYSAADDINSFGDIAGISKADTGETHAIMWTRARGEWEIVDLGLFGHMATGARAINDDLQLACGWLDHDLPQKEGVVFYRDGEWEDIGTLGTLTYAHAINAPGIVCGGSQIDATVHGFIWHDGVLTDLNECVVLPPEAFLSTALDINDAGWIVSGLSYEGDTPDPGALLIPVGSADLNGDEVIDVEDLLALLAAWGDCPDPPNECPADIWPDGQVDVLDLLELLAQWGPIG